MTEIQIPTHVKPAQEARPQASLWHRLGEHLNGFRQEAVMGLGCISAAAVFAVTLGKQESAFASPYMAGDTPANIGGVLDIESPLSKEKIKSELTGLQVQLVCAYPKDVAACEIDRVREAGEGMQNFLKHPDHGAPGFSMRISTVEGKMTVIPVKLDKNTSEITEMARNVSDDSLARHNLITLFEDQVHEKVGNDPETQYAVFLSGTPPLGKEGYGCSPTAHWNAAASRNVLVEYLTSNCDPGNPYHGFRAPSVHMLADIIHNDGWLKRCSPGFIDSGGDDIGYSSDPNELIGYDISSNWFYRRLTPAVFEPGRYDGCDNLADDNPRFAWQINAGANGKGLIEYIGIDGSVIKLDPGSRLPVGTSVETRYKPAAGEKFKGWSGDCKGLSPCEFIVNKVISLQANTEQLPQVTTYEVTVQAKGFSAIGIGKRCIEFCKVNKKRGSTFEIRAVDLPKKPVMKILGWLGCDKVINKKNVGEVCQVKNLSRNRKLTAKTAPAR